MKQIIKTVVLALFLITIGISPLFAHQPQSKNGAELKIALKKLLNLGSILYIAAHPDDENTSILAYMSRERLMRTGYLSITRGGGGQNLIGSEKGSLMSLIRTHELLEARKIDGAEQFFTRAVDFGYSKTAEESLSIWGKENVLADVVFIIRKFKPDVLISRFSPKTGSSGHGHHIASAILAVEAFDAAGDPSQFPEQLEYVSIWKPKRLFWNDWRPHWRPGEITAEERSKLISVDVGTYNTLLGKSYYEIAAISRSMHKSQGFGAMPRRGQWLDYFSLLSGTPVTKDLFEGIDTSWRRVPGSEKVRRLLEKAERSFRFQQPKTIIPVLIEAWTELLDLPESHWTRLKIEELKEVIRLCAGLWMEAIASTHTVIPGMEIKVTASVINRSGFPFILKELVVPGEIRVHDIRHTLEENIPYNRELSLIIKQAQVTQPYWLREKPGPGIHNDGGYRFRGLPSEPYPFKMNFILQTRGKELCFEAPLEYRWRDPVEGEKIRIVTVMPPATVNFLDQVFYFPGTEAQKIGMVLKSGPMPVSGELKLSLPPLWKVEPESIRFEIEEPFGEKRILADIIPPVEDTSGEITAGILVRDKWYHYSDKVIAYPHLPLLTVHPRAEARLVRVDLKRIGKRIGYIMGSGDDIPTYLSQVGYQVELLSDQDLAERDLVEFQAIITGIRAYNTRSILKHTQKRLMEYVFNGGVLIVQYNVNRGLNIQQLGPYPFSISRIRVSEEKARVTVLDSRHPVLQYPNAIGPVDFEEWVQERGLYFADQWDSEYTTLISCCDSGEESQPGGLLFARYGKGAFFYTGYSFFRQLPAGIPGALKLFVNMIDCRFGLPSSGSKKE